MRAASLLLLLLASCGPSATSQPLPPPEYLASTAPSPQSSAGPVSGTAPASSSEASSSAVAEPKQVGAPARPPPQPLKRTGKKWPFHAFNRAEAFSFNRTDITPVRPTEPDPDWFKMPLLRVVSHEGWSRAISESKPLSPELMTRAMSLTVQGQGEMLVSKCPFPRHAVVFYQDDLPVASVNVCFSCGDIMIWPRWDGAPDDTEYKFDMRLWELDEKRQERLYPEVFPQWERFFRDDVGYRIDEKFE